MRHDRERVGKRQQKKLRRGRRRPKEGQQWKAFLECERVCEGRRERRERVSFKVVFLTTESFSRGACNEGDHRKSDALERVKSKTVKKNEKLTVL